MCNIGEPAQEYPERFDLSEDEEELETEYFGRIMQLEGIQSEMHVLFVGDQDGGDDDDWMEDELRQWCSES